MFCGMENLSKKERTNADSGAMRGDPQGDREAAASAEAAALTGAAAPLAKGVTGADAQAKGVTKAVEIYFNERLDWLVAQLHLHYMPDWESRPGTMLLERRDPDVIFDGLCTIRACEYPEWLLAAEAQRTGAPSIEHVAEAYAEASLGFQDMTGMATAHLHAGKYVKRVVCRSGDRERQGSSAHES